MLYPRERYSEERRTAHRHRLRLRAPPACRNLPRRESRRPTVSRRTRHARSRHGAGRGAPRAASRHSPCAPRPLPAAGTPRDARDPRAGTWVWWDVGLSRPASRHKNHEIQKKNVSTCTLRRHYFMSLPSSNAHPPQYVGCSTHMRSAYQWSRRTNGT